MKLSISVVSRLVKIDIDLNKTLASESHIVRKVPVRYFRPFTMGAIFFIEVKAWSGFYFNKEYCAHIGKRSKMSH